MNAPRIFRFVEFACSQVALELIQKYPPAFTLAAIIAHRARWNESTPNPHNLELGEALIGDWQNYCASEREYRTSKSTLEKWGLATFKATSRKSTGKLIDSRVFKINYLKNGERNAAQVASETTSETTTNLEQQNREQKNDKAYSTTKGSKKLSKPQWEMARRIETSLGDEWINDAGKWVNRIKSNRSKCERVIAEVELAARESRIKTTPARYAEQIWKEFAP